MFSQEQENCLKKVPNKIEYFTVQELENIVDYWKSCNVKITELGMSRNNKHAIHMASFGDGPLSFLAWGYPHPDEPIGASALVHLGDFIIENPSVFSEWTINIILCADPENVDKQKWLKRKNLKLEHFLQGSWRPTHIGLEVDYGFPLDYDVFWHPEDYQGSCRLTSECQNNCGKECKNKSLPWSPLKESLILAKAIEITSPNLLALMHGTHGGGEYTFLLSELNKETQNDLVSCVEKFGLFRHKGLFIDRGRKIGRNPDLIKERNLEWFSKKLRKHPDFDEDYVYPGCHSASVFAEVHAKQLDQYVQVITPESTHFRHENFADVSLFKEKTETYVSVEERPKRGKSKVFRTETELGKQIYKMETTDEPLSSEKKRKSDVSFSLLAVKAIYQRKKALQDAKEIFNKLPKNFVYHPFLDEVARWNWKVEDEGWLRYCLNERYQRPATKAEAASWMWLWPLQSAALLSNFVNFLSFQSEHNSEYKKYLREVISIQNNLIESLPEKMKKEGNRKNAVQSMLARVFIVMNDVENRSLIEYLFDDEFLFMD